MQTDTYLLQRGILASCRLTAQHHLITQRVGGLLYPAISNEIRSRKDLAIADVGCGNGIWAIEAAEEYPAAEVIGIDVSDAQFPAPWTCPENCSFHILDMMQPVHQDYKCCFDMINVRLLAGLAGPPDGNDFTPIVDNLLQMLKPNGWIQWLDISSPVIRAHDSSTPSVIPQWRMPSSVTTQLPIFIKSVYWLDNLPALLKKRGFMDIERYECPPKESTLKHEADNTALAIMGLGQSSPGIDPAAAEFNDAVAEMLEEIQDGRLFTTVLQTTIGRKAHRALRKRKPKANMALEWTNKERE
jgi:SAM-dependent methyltransferase